MKELIERTLESTRQFFQRFDGWDSMAIFYTPDITTKQAGALFDVALEELLFLAHFAEAVANNHAEVIARGQVPSKYVRPTEVCGCDLDCGVSQPDATLNSHSLS